MCCTLPAYAMGYFITIILKGLLGIFRNQFLSAVFFAWLSDKYRRRAGFIAIQGLISITGYL
ncbi:hypothetical protein B0H13DRAFT_1995875 [Mycena leptocephala]|nr:hypothetical protein B0H13DRAFT_1995875 [Mycena leptocephala]